MPHLLLRGACMSPARAIACTLALISMLLALLHSQGRNLAPLAA